MERYPHSELKSLCTQHKDQLPSHIKCTASRLTLFVELARLKVIDVTRWSVAELREAVDFLKLNPIGTGKAGRLLKQDLLSAITRHLQPSIAYNKQSPKKDNKPSPKKDNKQSPKKDNKQSPKKAEAKQSPKKDNKPSPKKAEVNASPKKDNKQSPKKAEVNASPKKDNKQSPKKDEMNASPKKDNKQSPKKAEVNVSPKKDNKQSPKKGEVNASPKKDNKPSPKKDNKQSPKKDNKQSPQKGEVKVTTWLPPKHRRLTIMEIITKLKELIKERAKQGKGNENRKLKDLDLEGVLAITLRYEQGYYLLFGRDSGLITELLPRSSDKGNNTKPTYIHNFGYQYPDTQTNVQRLSLLLGAIRELNRQEDGTVIVAPGYMNKAYGVIGFDTPYTDPSWMRTRYPSHYPTIENPIRTGEDSWSVIDHQPHDIAGLVKQLAEVEWGESGTTKLQLYPSLLDDDTIVPLSNNEHLFAIRPMKLVDGTISYKLVDNNGTRVRYPEEGAHNLILTIARILHLLREGFGGSSDLLLDEEVVLAQRLVRDH